ncbi:hypothetical protein EAI_01828 [Harpegnathos saltator]|uniref:GDNF/GAS1 domain-containing protein n=1 Tax=Harpegnathos saltator TaxID=610380 RepID=E2B7C3_HARSA|nr:hypothetical protein EAI_01828 [Harpegnathos saltator]
MTPSSHHVEYKDQFSIDALPTCNHAVNVCGRDKVCTQMFKEFKINCKIQEGKCNMENRQQKCSSSLAGDDAS